MLRLPISARTSAPSTSSLTELRGRKISGAELVESRDSHTDLRHTGRWREFEDGPFELLLFANDEIALALICDRSFDDGDIVEALSARLRRSRRTASG